MSSTFDLLVQVFCRECYKAYSGQRINLYKMLLSRLKDLVTSATTMVMLL